MRKVIIETPYGAATQEGVERNLRYLRACLGDCHRRGEAPIASHGLHTQPGVLDDRVPAEREQGIAAGFAWRADADATVVYTDLGTSGGMRAGIANASDCILDDASTCQRIGLRTDKLVHRIEYRSLGEGWDRPELATELWGRPR